jgi:GNAT superfamily N-acetyltransferase
MPAHIIEAPRPVDVREESVDALAEYARIPSAFVVDRLLRVQRDSVMSPRWTFVEEMLATPFTKDYDAIPHNHPTDWPRFYDTARWRLYSAYAGERRVGGAIVVPPSSISSTGADELVSEIWDLRVHPEWQRRGVATALWNHIESVVSTPLLRVETQHINVPACAFYAARGCTLSVVEPLAYELLPDEVRLVWEKHIGKAQRVRSN